MRGRWVERGEARQVSSSFFEGLKMIGVTCLPSIGEIYNDYATIKPEIQHWLSDNFGKKWKVMIVAKPGGMTIAVAFEDELDAVLFKMFWSDYLWT
jgi:hypothetical protein